MEYRKVTEGTTTLEVPIQDENSAFPPSTADIFYNNVMELNRDITVLLTSFLKPEEYLDAMSATGIRGLRIANETNTPTILNDNDPKSVELINRNAETINKSTRVICDDANHLMCSERFDAIDIDPFGTPIPFLDAASRSAKRYLFVTATDTAPLCGAHLNAGKRRYFSNPRNTEYHSEVGLRILMATIARELVKYDRGMLPLLSFAKDHYFRSHINVIAGVKGAEATMDNIGFIMQCKHCLYRTEQKGILLPTPHTCPICNSNTVPIGPLWVGPLQNKKVVLSLIQLLPNTQFKTVNQMDKLFNQLLQEPDTSSFYDYHIISRYLRVSPPPIYDLISELHALGYIDTVRTHFSLTGIKTSAPLQIIQDLILNWTKNKKDN
ncbi:MAG TPA: tRNA (guanine(10)-N(2))-dimethyltransferase [Methanocorpusculum sp.]|nr:tRNA (guanine(10)-N(2))-dimethyltransferase [Methanocorpusculum sp.]